jgi:hypothetical protein
VPFRKSRQLRQRPQRRAHTGLNAPPGMASSFDNQQSRPFRGGTFSNKQWIAGRGSNTNTNTPALGSTPMLGPDGKWERGGHAGGGRGRGRGRGLGRGRGESRDGRTSVSPFASPNRGGETELPPVVEPESVPVREKTWEEVRYPLATLSGCDGFQLYFRMACVGMGTI